MGEAAAMEEYASVKGSRLGFSSWTHRAVQIMLSCPGAVIEEESSYDISRHIDGPTTDIIRIEITGLNYATKKVNAKTVNLVLNKYPLLDLLTTYEVGREAIKFSAEEDKGDPQYLKSTAYDQGDSPYSKVIR